jgi:hypothetical protein
MPWADGDTITGARRAFSPVLFRRQLNLRPRVSYPCRLLCRLRGTSLNPMYLMHPDQRTWFLFMALAFSACGAKPAPANPVAGTASAQLLLDKVP